MVAPWHAVLLLTMYQVTTASVYNRLQPTRCMLVDNARRRRYEALINLWPSLCLSVCLSLSLSLYVCVCVCVEYSPQYKLAVSPILPLHYAVQ